MAIQQIPLKLRSSIVPGKVPAAADFTQNTFCVNLADGKLYWRDAGGTIRSHSLFDPVIPDYTLGENAVATSNLQNGSVTTVKQADKGTTNAKLADVPSGTFKGRTAAGAGPVSDIAISALFGDYVGLATDQDITGRKAIIGSTGDLPSSTTTVKLEVRAAEGSGNAAYMAFHRPGIFAAYFGIGTDNNWYVGGWSYGSSKFRIYKQGDAVAYGAVSANGNVSSTGNVTAAGTVGATGNVTSGANITAVGNVTSSFSDERLKEKLSSITNALEKVMSLRVFTYEPNADARELGVEDNGREVGLSAQEVMKVLPEAVHPSPLTLVEGYVGPDYLTIQYERVVPLLVAAVQELTKLVQNRE